MAYKLYEDEHKNVIDKPSLTRYFVKRVKWGYTGRDHSTPRPYVNTQCSGSVSGAQTSGDIEDVDLFDIDSIWSHTFDHNDRNIFHNRVVSRLRGRLGPSAQLGTQIFAEGTEAVQLAVKNLQELASIARALRKKDISRLKKAWKGRRRAQRAMAEAGGRWLEFSWGWVPTVQTIASALEMTGMDLPPYRITSTHSTSKTCSEVMKYPNGTKYNHFHCRWFKKCGFQVTVSNPNIWLLSSLDLINPGTWIYEAIPYSWFVDYFANVGSVISGMGQFAGLSIDGRYSTTSYEGELESVLYTRSGDNPHTVRGRSSGRTIRRSLETPDLDVRLTYNFKNPLTTSWRRGLNSASFLATRLR